MKHVNPDSFYLEDTVYGQESPISRARYYRLFKILEGVPGGSLLDVGCGDGYLMQRFKSQRPDLEIAGVDVSKAAIDKAKENGFNVVLGDTAGGLPFPDDTFDIIHAGELIEHVCDTDYLLDEIARVLKPKGTLLLSTPNLACWMNRFLLLFGIQPIYTEVSYRRNFGRRFKFLGRESMPIGHLRVFTYGAAKEILRAHQFDIIKAAGCAVVLQRPISMIDRLLSIFPSLASDIIYVATNEKGT